MNILVIPEDFRKDQYILNPHSPDEVAILSILTSVLI